MEDICNPHLMKYKTVNEFFFFLTLESKSLQRIQTERVFFFWWRMLFWNFWLQLFIRFLITSLVML